jgi:hypothetical protein
MCGQGENSSDVILNGAGALDSRHDRCGDSGAINVTVIVDLKCTLAAVTGGGTVDVNRQAFAPHDQSYQRHTARIVFFPLASPKAISRTPRVAERQLSL